MRRNPTANYLKMNLCTSMKFCYDLVTNMEFKNLRIVNFKKWKKNKFWDIFHHGYPTKCDC